MANNPPGPEEIVVPVDATEGAEACQTIEVADENGAATRLRIRVAVREAPDGPGDSEYAAKEPDVSFWRRPLRLLPPGLAIAVFLFLCSGLLSRFITPLNGDEAETAFFFSVNQHWANLGARPTGEAQEASPLGMGAAYSGMHNLTFWLRSIPYGRFAWARENFEVWNRIHNLIATFMMLWLLYGLGRWALGPTFALIAVFIATFMQYTFLLAIEGNYLNETSAALLAATWAFLAAERSRRRGAQGALGAAAGAFAAIAWMLYFSGRLAGAGLLLYCAFRFVMDKRWLRRTAPALIGFAAIYGPALVFFKIEMDRHPEMASFRQADTQLLRNPQILEACKDFESDSILVVAGRSILRAFESYCTHANNYHSYGAKGYLDGMSALLLFVGVAIALWRWRHPFYLMILSLFAMHNVALGGLTTLPGPPYHQRVHFAILLSAYFVAMPLWLWARAPKRWGEIGQWLAAIACLLIAVANSRRFMEREFGKNDPYMRTARRASIMSAYIQDVWRGRELVTFNQGPDVIGFNNGWASFDPQFRDPEARIISLEEWRALGRKGVATRAEKRLLFIVQDYRTAAGTRDAMEIAAEREIEGAIPGGKWIALDDDEGLPYARVYIAPKAK